MADLLFLMIKPWSLHHAREILAEFDKGGKKLKEAFIEKMPIELIARHYGDHKEKRIMYWCKRRKHSGS